MTKFKKIIFNLKWAILQGFIKALDFKSRATRMEFWGFLFPIVLVKTFVDLHFFLGNELGPISLILTLILFVPSLSLTIRRLHDTNRSAWYLLLGPTIIGAFFLLYFYCVRGSDEENKYGPARKNLEGR